MWLSKNDLMNCSFYLKLSWKWCVCMYMYTHTHVYAYTYIIHVISYIYIYICMYVYKIAKCPVSVHPTLFLWVVHCIKNGMFILDSKHCKNTAFLILKIKQISTQKMKINISISSGESCTSALPRIELTTPCFLCNTNSSVDNQYRWKVVFVW